MNNEYIILKWVGRWVLHETPATHPNIEEATHEAANLDCKSLVLSIEQVARVFEAFIETENQS